MTACGRKAIAGRPIRQEGLTARRRNRRPCAREGPSVSERGSSRAKNAKDAKFRRLLLKELQLPLRALRALRDILFRMDPRVRNAYAKMEEIKRASGKPFRSLPREAGEGREGATYFQPVRSSRELSFGSEISRKEREGRQGLERAFAPREGGNMKTHFSSGQQYLTIRQTKKAGHSTGLSLLTNR